MKRKQGDKCDVCGMGMGDGYEESFGTKVGTYRICGSCHTELKRKGHLHIEAGKILPPDGIVQFVDEPIFHDPVEHKHPDTCPLCHRFCKLLEHRHTWYCSNCNREFPDLE